MAELRNNSSGISASVYDFLQAHGFLAEKSSSFLVCGIYLGLFAVDVLVDSFAFSSRVTFWFGIIPTLFTVYYICYAFLRYRFRGVMRAYSLFFLLILGYGVASLFFGRGNGEDRRAFIMMAFSSMGPVYAFFVFAKQGKLTRARMSGLFLFFVIVTTIEFFAIHYSALALNSSAENIGDITNGSSYLFVALVPLLFLQRQKPVVTYLWLAYIAFFSIIGMKRGAILLLLLMIFWVVYVSMNSYSRLRKVAFVVFACLFLFLSVELLELFYQKNFYFQHRVERTLSGDSSGRDVLYSTLWNHFRHNDNLVQLFFGQGAFYTRVVTGEKLAHNDWLELLIDCGLSGVVVYLVYWISFLFVWIKCKRYNLLFSVMGMCLTYVFVKTFFSMSFNSMPFCITMLLGYCFAHVNKNPLHEI